MVFGGSSLSSPSLIAHVAIPQPSGKVTEELSSQLILAARFN